jgi:hypothetical protein
MTEFNFKAIREIYDAEEARENGLRSPIGSVGTGTEAPVFSLDPFLLAPEGVATSLESALVPLSRTNALGETQSSAGLRCEAWEGVLPHTWRAGWYPDGPLLGNNLAGSGLRQRAIPQRY